MNLGIQNKVAVVAAASRGLGFAAAMELAKEGARVVICSRNQDAIQTAANQISKATGSEVAGIAVDLSTAEGAQKVIEFAVSSFGNPSILVTNNGGPPATKLENTTESQWMSGFEQTLMSSIRLVNLVAPAMKKQQWGRIINITSIAVKQPIDGLLISNALRAGVVGFARTIANELAPFGITVNNVCPGYTRTERLIKLAESMKPGIPQKEAFTVWTSQIPAGRVGEPEELAALITFLASERAAFITGTTIPVDGGYYRGLM